MIIKQSSSNKKHKTTKTQNRWIHCKNLPNTDRGMNNNPAKNPPNISRENTGKLILWSLHDSDSKPTKETRKQKKKLQIKTQGKY